MTDLAVSTALPPSDWTIGTLAAHHDALRQADLRFQEERDRRYAEVTAEREKALKIKETADLAALSLAREIQTYKDEKANELRAQINSERGLYVTRTDLAGVVDKWEATMAPISKYVTAQQGAGRGLANLFGYVIAGAGIIVAIVAVVLSQ